RSIIIENGKWIIENDCVAFGHYLNYFPEENTTIFNFQLSIFNSLGRAINRNLLLYFREKVWYNGIK
ncbi:MAG: hypothetical protein IJO45_05625, partial [Oscillospiraceae bacterium]|nr:hypothetical protein [Oscillospiraceae bacterium]